MLKTLDVPKVKKFQQFANFGGDLSERLAEVLGRRGRVLEVLQARRRARLEGRAGELVEHARRHGRQLPLHLEIQRLLERF